MSAITDFKFYFKYRKERKFCGQELHKFKFNRNGINAVEAFIEIDQKGNGQVETRHPRILASVFNCKKSINWQIKEWASGCAHFYFSIYEILQEPIFKDQNTPKWLEKSLRNQRWKIAFENEYEIKRTEILKTEAYKTFFSLRG